MLDRRDLLARRLRAVEERLQAACQRAGRSRSEVTLVAVTKTVSAETAALLPEVPVLPLEVRQSELEPEQLMAFRQPWPWRYRNPRQYRQRPPDRLVL